MKAVIMAGGEGTRLRPLTSLRPKPMVPIVNQPVMEHIVRLVKRHGISEIVATLAFMPQAIQDYFGAGEEWGVNICYAIEETPLGTAGSVKNAQKYLDDGEPFVVISGDALTDIDLTDLIEQHRKHGGAVTIALKHVEDPLDFGVVITGENGRIERFLEKPTWGQVFSDLINTGIYVVEPWVIDEIPDGEAYDFSGELFPKMMAEGHEVYGVPVDCYWCDVGSRESYLDVHRDILDGRANVFMPGARAREGLWIGENSQVDTSAKLGAHVVIGANCKIAAGARLGDYTVIGDNCVIAEKATISHSVLWDDTFAGEGASVTGSVMCRHVDVRSRAVIDVGATIGDESMVGHGAHVGADVQVYPYKRIEPGAMVKSSLIWESTAVRSLFSEGGICGLVGIDITPELALNVAEAFGTTLPKGGHVVVTRDTSRQARMVKRAMVSGLNATGINVRDLRVASPALSRFTTQKTRCVGGIHIGIVADDPQSLEIRFFDKNGLDISPADQKKIERLYFRGEFRRMFFGEVGEIIYPPRPLEYYTAALDDAVAEVSGDGQWHKIVADMRCGSASLVFPQVAHAWHLTLVSLNAMVDTESGGVCPEVTAEQSGELARSVELFGADFGVTFDSGAERIRLVTPHGQALDSDTELHAVVDLWCRTRDATKGAIAVPLTASMAVELIAEKYGRRVIRPGRSRRALAQAVLDGRAVFAGSVTGGFIFGDFFPAFDGVLAVGLVATMLDQAHISLDDLVDDLPEFHKVSASVFCPTERKGAVMRAVTEESTALQVDLTEGVRIIEPDGWALVLPDAMEPTVMVWAEADDDTKAEQRLSRWRDVVETAIAQV